VSHAPSPARFAAALARRDAAGRARFLAALERARGREARVSGSLVRVTVAGRTRLIAVHDPGPGPLRGSIPRPEGLALDDLDAVVSPRRDPGLDLPGGVALRDADDLRAATLYAVPPAARDDLLDRLAPDTGGRPGRPPAVETALVAVAALLLVVALVAAPSDVGAGVALDGPDRPTVSAPPAATGDRSASPDRTDDGPAPTATGAGLPPWVNLPPGVARDGVTDERALAAAHTRAVRSRSYRLTVTHREYADGRPTAVRTETVVVGPDGRYASRIRGFGRLTERSLVLSRAEWYAAGPDGPRFRRPVDPATGRADGPVERIGPDDGGARFAARVERYLVWSLSVRSSRVADVRRADGRSYVWLTYRGDDYAGVDAVNGSAAVDARGTVHELRRRYAVPDRDGVTVAVTVRYDRVGEATVGRPSWVPANGTAAGSNASSPAVTA
jgi:hypothetical protein